MNDEMPTIEEMIAILVTIKEEHGNIKVALQYQDGGGCYPGHTEGELSYSIENEDGKPVLVIY